MKQCFKCGRILPLDEFYRHSEMLDGHLNKCKECTKRDVAEHYLTNREKIDAYERERFKTTERKAKLLLYQRRSRARHPEKDRARAAVCKAIQRGILIRKPCEVCNTTIRVQAHHDDYSKPLDVRWLCFKHHREIGHNQTVTATHEFRTGRQKQMS